MVAAVPSTPVHLANTVGRQRFFQRQIRRHLTYWHQHPAIKTVEIKTLDARRDSILSVIAYSLNLAEAWPEARELVINFASYMERRGYWSLWQPILEQAIAAAQTAQDTDGEITLTALLARLCQRQSRPQATIQHYRRVIRVARRTGNHYELARACSNLGYAYIDVGYWWRSEVLCCWALTIFEDLGSDHGLAHTHNHLGVLHQRQRIWLKAEYHFKQACNQWKSMDDEHGLIYGYENLGSLYCDMEQPESALNYLHLALDLSSKTGEKTEIGNIWTNLGLVYRQKKDYSTARRYTQQAADIFNEGADLFKLAHVWNHLGVIYQEQTDWDKASYYLNQAALTFRSLGNKERQITVLADLINYEIARRNRIKAIKNINQFESLILNYFQENLPAHLKEDIKNFRHRSEAL